MRNIFNKSISYIPQIYWLILLMVTALSLRLFHLDQYGLWFDEAISYHAAQLDLKSILTNQINSSHPPLYYLILHYWITYLPTNDFSARMLSVMWNVALIPVVFLTAKKLFNNVNIALMASLLTVISPFHIAYSQELRMYTQYMFFTTSGFLVYLYAIKRNHFIQWSLFTGLFVCAIYTHYFACFFLVGLFVYEFIFGNNRIILKNLFYYCSFIFILFIPWAYIVLSRPDFSEGSLRPLFEGSSGNFSFFTPLLNISIILFLPLTKDLNYLYIAISLYISLALLIFTIYYILKYKYYYSHNVILLLTVIFTITSFPSFFHYVNSMYFPYQSLAAALPLLIIVISLFFFCHDKFLIHISYLVIFFFIIGTAFYYYENNKNFFKIQNHELSQFMIVNCLHHDNILHLDDFSYLPLLRYNSFSNHARLHDNDSRLLLPVSSYKTMGGELWDLDDLYYKSGRLWLIVAGIKNREWQMRQRDILLQKYTLIDKYTIKWYKIYLLDIDN